MPLATTARRLFLDVPNALATPLLPSEQVDVLRVALARRVEVKANESGPTISTYRTLIVHQQLTGGPMHSMK